jgi:hypothetical protein
MDWKGKPILGKSGYLNPTHTFAQGGLGPAQK